MPSATAAALIRLAADSGMPLKTLLLAVHARVLACLCGQDEIVTGLVSNGRPADADGAEALGLFLNTLPLRVRVGGSWRALLAETMTAEGNSLPRRFFPLAEILKLDEAARFDASFNYVDFHVYRELSESGGLEVLDSSRLEAVDIPLAVTFSAPAAPRAPSPWAFPTTAPPSPTSKWPPSAGSTWPPPPRWRETPTPSAWTPR
ncbi:condensation domain-containing protein [Chromobacterium haemolyticum]|nr:condensation domain-containing protein [Chromobacterium haemolyticum]